MDHTSSSPRSSQSSPQSSPLLALPPELSERIISLVSDPSRRSQLKAVLLTCKQLHEIALPFWVESYVFDEQSKVYDFLRFITIAQPGLAACVKRIDVLLSCDMFETSTFRGLLDPTELSVYTDLLRSAYPRASGRYDIARHKRSQTAVYILLAACNKVETLVLPRTTFLGPDPIQSAASNAPEPVLQILSALRHVTLVSDPDDFHEYLPSEWIMDEYLWLRNTVVLLKLPNIRDFDISEAVGIYSEQDLSLNHVPTFPNEQSNVENMRFHLSVLSPPILQKIVRYSKRLKTFEYSIDWLLHGFDEVRQVRAGDVMAAVKAHAGTLETLRLEFGDDFAKLGMEDLSDDHIYLGLNLRQMTALKILSASMQALTGRLDLLPLDHPNPTAHPRTREGAPRLVQCLAPNLEELTITNCGSEILEQVQELLDAVASGSFPHLRVVALAFNIEQTPPDSVRLTCEAPDVSIQLRYESLKERSSRIGLSSEQVDALIAARVAMGMPLGLH
jgi:hypothetical protein